MRGFYALSHPGVTARSLRRLHRHRRVQLVRLDVGSGGHEAGDARRRRGVRINTDCTDPLVCTFEHCHEACAQSRDCTGGERCILVSGVGVCELPTESSCASGSCAAPLVCGPDMQCRVGCPKGGSGCAAGQVCSGGLCYDAAGDSGTGGDSSSD